MSNYLDFIYLYATGWDRAGRVAAVAASAEAPLPLPHHTQLGGQLSHLLRPLTLDSSTRGSNQKSLQALETTKMIICCDQCDRNLYCISIRIIRCHVFIVASSCEWMVPRVTLKGFIGREMGDYHPPARGTMEIIPPEDPIIPPEACIIPPEGCRRPKVEAARNNSHYSPCYS